jgi:hypothetical protein
VRQSGLTVWYDEYDMAYGAQSVAQMFGQRQSWDEEGAFASFARCCSAEGLAAARHLYNLVRQQKASFTWGKGSLPSLSGRFLIGGTPCSIFTLYEWPAGKALCAINFEFLVGGTVPAVAVARLADRLRTIPKVTECLEGLEQAEYKKRPVLPVDPILAQPGAVETIESAIMELVESARV